MSSIWDSDDELESVCSSSDSDYSFDDDDVNRRVKPLWSSFPSLFELHGIQLDTVRHVKEYYNSRGLPVNLLGYTFTDENALCPDYGLPDYFFRGTRLCDGKEVIIKAVHFCSREYDVIRILSSPPLRDDPMNHTIPVLDLIVAENDGLTFIVMEHWSSRLVLNDISCCFASFLSATRQCIEHVAFLHKNHIVHLDISAHNILMDYNGRYAFIDYETSRRFVSTERPVLCNYRGTEVPPECEREGPFDPYKVDIWALGTLIFRACKSMGYTPPGMMQLVKLMLQERPERRPSASYILNAFTDIFAPGLDALCNCASETSV